LRSDRQRAELLQGKSKKTEAGNSEVIVINNFRTKKIPPLVWRQGIKKVWEMDLFLCSHCGGLMEIVRFIYDNRVNKKILTHLGLLWGEEQKRGPPTPPKKCLGIVVEPFGDYCHFFARKGLGELGPMPVINFERKNICESCLGRVVLMHWIRRLFVGKGFFRSFEESDFFSPHRPVFSETILRRRILSSVWQKAKPVMFCRQMLSPFLRRF
jgi:hypothetical protein